MVLLGWATAWRLAGAPTSRSLVLGLKPTTEGVVSAPSGFGITLGGPPAMTATQLLVVPRSMPMILPMGSLLLRVAAGGQAGLRPPCPPRIEERNLPSIRSSKNDSYFLLV